MRRGARARAVVSGNNRRLTTSRRESREQYKEGSQTPNDSGERYRQRRASEARRAHATDVSPWLGVYRLSRRFPSNSIARPLALLPQAPRPTHGQHVTQPSPPIRCRRCIASAPTAVLLHCTAPCTPMQGHHCQTLDSPPSAASSMSAIPCHAHYAPCRTSTKGSLIIAADFRCG